MEAHAPAFDTHKAVKTLRNAGAQEPLAEAVVTTVDTAVSEQVTAMREQMATKADLKALEQRIIIRLGGMMVVGFGILAILIKL